MKKIALISFVKSYNYGASLQVYALWYAITNRLSYEGDCIYIDYKRSYRLDLFVWLLRKVYRKIRLLDDTPSYSVRELIHEVLLIKNDKNTYSRELEEKFNRFWNLTPYTNQIDKKSLSSLNQFFDIFIVGSDQVWNPGKVNLDTSYLLDFVDDLHSKYSYASSIGMPNIPLKYKEKYQKSLSRFKSISLREHASVEIVEDLLSRTTDVYCHCDPTLLLDRNTWDKISKNAVEMPNNYILVYDLTDKDITCARIAELIAKNTNIHICYVSQKNGYGPLEWIQLFLHAEFIVTNSFHGTAFSVNFSKEFISVIPSADIFQKSKNRICSLLKEVGIEGRIMEESNIENMSEEKIYYYIHQLEKINYFIVQERVSTLRKQGLEYLERCLDES